MIRVPALTHSYPRLLAWCAALMAVALWHALALWISNHVLDMRLADAAYLRDLLAHLLLGAVLFALAQSLPRFLLAAMALLSVLTFGNAMKLATLGAPLMPDDFAAARNLFLFFEGWTLIGAGLLVAVPTLLVLGSIAWTRRTTWITLALLAGTITALIQFPAPLVTWMDHHFGHSVWNQPANYQARGLPIHLLQETSRALARREPPPTVAQVDTALQQLAELSTAPLLPVNTSLAAPHPKRALYMIVLESFWDPMILTAAHLSADPLDPAFRQLWAQAGQAHLLAPVFGGYTANTEFEVLCGFPVTADNVFFETGLKRDVPCLPAHLREAGYHSLASHPNAASFWNRVNAYRRIGFETYWSERDFVLDDMNRAFLSDASLYRQVMDKLAHQAHDPRPVFNYILTYFGHLPYPLNEHRPPLITAAAGHEIIAAYANTLYYKSRELMDFVRTVRATDPEALIVLFGDHLPALKPNFGGYTESGVLAPQRGALTDAMFRTLVATPLIVIDGKRGPLAVGDLPAYQLPALLLELLGDTRPSLLQLTAPQQTAERVRPLPGVHWAVTAHGERVCRGQASDAPDCAASTRWLQALKTVRTDLFSGQQHTLLDLHRPKQRLRAAGVGL